VMGPRILSRGSGNSVMGHQEFRTVAETGHRYACQGSYWKYSAIDIPVTSRSDSRAENMM